MRKTSLHKEAFGKGVDVILTLAPLRKLFGDVARVTLDKLEHMPTFQEMHIDLIKKIRRLGRF